MGEQVELAYIVKRALLRARADERGGAKTSERSEVHGASEILRLVINDISMQIAA
jgi:hypothetical protein